jgi:hypothetical protein
MKKSYWPSDADGDVMRRLEAGGFDFEVDLPLNGKWSDLRADFVLFDHEAPAICTLRLEEISSWRQANRNFEQREADL